MASRDLRTLIDAVQALADRGDSTSADAASLEDSLEEFVLTASQTATVDAMPDAEARSRWAVEAARARLHDLVASSGASADIVVGVLVVPSPSRSDSQGDTETGDGVTEVTRTVEEVGGGIDQTVTQESPPASAARSTAITETMDSGNSESGWRSSTCQGTDLAWSLQDHSAAATVVVFTDSASLELVAAGAALPGPLAALKPVRLDQLENQPLPRVSDGQMVFVEVGHDLAAYVNRFRLCAALRLLRYELVRRVGQGGFGEVFLAKHFVGGQSVAIKVLHARRAADEGERAGFWEEWELVRNVTHPNIVEWKGFDEMEDGAYLFVMELLEGAELSELLKNGAKLPADRVAGLLLQILDALRSTHDKGVVHLDLKPDNVFVVFGPGGEGDERAKVLDFGIGQFVNVEAAGGPAAAGSEATPGVLGDEVDENTLVGNTMSVTAGSVARCRGCTPSYASPEQASHWFEDVPPGLDGRSDLYSLGVVAFRMLTGRLPFEREEGGTSEDLLRSHVETRPPAVRSCERSVPRELAAFVDRSLIKDPERRWKDSEQAYRTLYGIVYPPKWKTALRFGWKLAAVLVIGFWVYQFFQPNERLLPALQVTEEGDVQLPPKVWLGPRRPELVLDFRGFEDEIPSEASLKLRGEGAEDWDVAWEGGGTTRVRVFPVGDGAAGWALDAAVIVVGLGSGTLGLGRETAKTEAFSVAWISGEWSIDSPGVEGRTRPRVYEAGAKLQFFLRGLVRDEIESLEVGSGLLPVQRDQRQLEYVCRLEELGLQEGKNAVPILVQDKAGNVKNASVDVDLVKAPLSMVIELRNGMGGPRLTPLGDGTNLYVRPEFQPILYVDLNRPAELFVELLDVISGEVLGERRQLGVVTKEQLDDGLELPLGIAEAAGGSDYLGLVRVWADETGQVYHAGADPTDDPAVVDWADEKKLTYQFDTSRVELSATLTASGFEARRLREGGAYETDGADLELTLTRTGTAPFDVRASLSSAAELDNDRSRDARLTEASPTETLSWDLPADGPYRLEVEAQQRPGGEPDLVLHGVVIRDTTGPVITVEGFDLEVWDPRTAGWPSSAVSAFAAPWERGEFTRETRLEWELQDGRGDAVPGLDLSALPTVLESGESIPISFPAASALFAGWRDGEYRWVVRGTDVLMRVSEPSVLDFELALAGPTLDVQQPKAPDVEPWRVESDGKHHIRVAIEDPNGIAEDAVDGAPSWRLWKKADESLVKSGTLTRDPESTNDWIGSVEFDRTWTKAEIILHVESVDRRGNLGEEDVERILDAVDTGLPAGVAVKFDGHDVQAMRRVWGNMNAGQPGYGDYFFRGRPQSEEDRAFLGAGLDQAHNTWAISYSKFQDGIGDYYLDENEVSCGEYLEFLRAETGFRDQEWWSGFPAATPVSDRDARAKELQRDYEGREGFPATELDWYEALAYARWVGKRLPSVVEWEYAARGGVAYRVYASQRAGEALPTMGELNVRDLGGKEAWSIDLGSDLTSDTRIRNLCSNVQEWTATPARRGDRPEMQARANPGEFLNPHHLLDLSRYFAAGPHFAENGFNYGAPIHDLRATTRKRSLGFRCAMSDVEVLAALQNEGRRLLVPTDDSR